MAVHELLRHHGFDEDPFESTNADNEPHLDKYFVPPPYFSTVKGDARNPQSQVILAPRGGGKTAQKRKLEIDSSSADNYLCITYDYFDQPSGFTLEQATLNYHLNQLCQRLLIAVLSNLNHDPDRIQSLTDHQKTLLKAQIDRFLGQMSAAEFQRACDALKTFGDRAKAFWNTYGQPLGVIANILLKRIGLDAIKVSAQQIEEFKKQDSLQYHLSQLCDMALKLGYNSTYVCIDKLDETALTNSSSASSFALIRTLITDLPTLEMKGIAFKFFLWDKVEDHYSKAGMRQDRIPVYRLKWTVAELEQMLSARLSAYSKGKTASLNTLCCTGESLDLHRLVCHLAFGSPRDMVRIAKRLIAETTRVADGAACIGHDSILSAIKNFSEERAEELFPGRLAEMRRIAKPTFTVNALASDVFKMNQQSVRAKVQSWQDSGLAKRIGDLPNPGNRPQNLYGILDLRVVIAMSSGSSLEEILGKLIHQCPDCAAMCANDRSTIDCIECERQFEAQNSRSLLNVCTVAG